MVGEGGVSTAHTTCAGQGLMTGFSPLLISVPHTLILLCPSPICSPHPTSLHMYIALADNAIKLGLFLDIMSDGFVINGRFYAVWVGVAA